MRKNLINEIDQFLSETGMGPHRFGMLAASNGRLVERLRAGRRIWPETEKQVRAFMKAARPTPKARTSA